MRDREDFPWRGSQGDPYVVWVSEVMLQQTQVAAVIPYLERWLKRFPTVKRLARAHPEEVLKLWEGLGYYSRARNLYRAAGIIVRELGGKFPTTVEGLLALPGLGEYSARSMAALAYEIPVLGGGRQHPPRLRPPVCPAVGFGPGGQGTGWNH